MRKFRIFSSFLVVVFFISFISFNPGSGHFIQFGNEAYATSYPSISSNLYGSKSGNIIYHGGTLYGNVILNININYSIAIADHPTDPTKLRLSLTSSGSVEAGGGSYQGIYVESPYPSFTINGVGISCSSGISSGSPYNKTLGYYYSNTNLIVDVPKRSDCNLVVEASIGAYWYYYWGGGGSFYDYASMSTLTLDVLKYHSLNSNPTITVATPLQNALLNLPIDIKFSITDTDISDTIKILSVDISGEGGGNKNNVIRNTDGSLYLTNTLVAKGTEFTIFGSDWFPSLGLGNHTITINYADNNGGTGIYTNTVTRFVAPTIINLQTPTVRVYYPTEGFL
jgi:hypothetical protein